MSKRRVMIIGLTVLLAVAVASLVDAQDASPNPDSVTIAGTVQTAMGCPGDWQPECEAAFLTYSEEDDLWMGTWDLPAGEYEYKAALNASWEPENYGLNAEEHGPNIPLSLAEDASVTFFYDHKTHWVTDNVNSIVANVAGSFQAALGCPGDWAPDCLRSWMQDPDGDDIYVFTTNALPAGDFEAKVALNQDWEPENYGLNGEEHGPNIPFSVAEDGQQVLVTYDAVSHMIEITVGGEATAETTETGGEEEEAAAPAPAGGAGGLASVTIAGTIQSVLGCPNDWAPECELTFLTFSPGDDLWMATFDLPAGNYEYKAALNQSWDENYGLNAEEHGPNIPLSLAEDTAVTFFYDHKTHWVTDSVNSVVASAPGSYQDEIGCPGDWQPDCLRSWMQDPDGDGLYEFSTFLIPAGDYEFKVAINQSWEPENYGLDGEEHGPNIPFSVPAVGHLVTMTYDAESHMVDVTVSEEPVATPEEIAAALAPASAGDLTLAKAHWVTADTIAWPLTVEEGASFALYYSDEANLRLSGEEVTGGRMLPLTLDENGLSDDVLAKFPHMEGYAALKIDAAALDRVPDILKGQTAVASTAANGKLIDATGLQIPGVLDDLYTYDGELGVVWDGDVPTLKVWAPTAQNVRLHLFSNPKPETFGVAVNMRLDPETGVWSITGQPSWKYKFYLYEVTVYAPTTGQIETNLVTDPYSVSLSTNSQRSQIVDLLNDTSLMPPGWAEMEKPPLDAPEDIVLYELHMRDFSVNDPTVPENFRGTFMAFTVQDSNGMQHLRNLAEAGLTHVHLLPVFDIATINENKSEWVQPEWDELASYPPDSEEQQAIIDPIRDQDAFNWGYDPFHYTVPEGSYSTNPNGTTRILQFRRMVQGLDEAGLRVVVDVVYNHTNANGQAEKSVLDKVVPGYYHRLNGTGGVETSTCCPNTATEHNMMRKLMIDSVVMWARAYKVDGFRFDLMGHHMVSDMVEVREALDALTIEENGVDGETIYVYGEGWNFGEVADNARGINATQLNLPGTGIGMFNDRIRDAARGGSPFGGRQDQGFALSLYTDPNDTTPGTEDEQLARLLLFSDQIRVGLAGNLADYAFIGANGEMITGKDVDYNGSPVGYTLDPQEHISYVAAHDNETLFDKIQYAAPADATVADRVRMQNMGISIVTLSQGVPFYHAGIDMLRSKDMDRDSVNSGDWFNKLDFTYETNNWGVGLPPASKNVDLWDIMRPLLANPDIVPGSDDIMMTVAHAQEMLQIRKSSKLFRLETAEDIMERVQFHNTGPDQIPGVIVMSISDMTADDLDPDHELIVVIFNGSGDDITFTDAELGGMELELHPVQADSADGIVKTTTFDSGGGTFSVPARTTAVFVLAE
jgi:pullulanase